MSYFQSGCECEMIVDVEFFFQSLCRPMLDGSQCVNRGMAWQGSLIRAVPYNNEQQSPSLTNSCSLVLISCPLVLISPPLNNSLLSKSFPSHRSIIATNFLFFLNNSLCGTRRLLFLGPESFAHHGLFFIIKENNRIGE